MNTELLQTKIARLEAGGGPSFGAEVEAMGTVISKICGKLDCPTEKGEWQSRSANG